VPNGGTPDAAGDPISHVFNRNRSQHVFYTSTFGNIVELSWQGAEIPRVRNLNFPNDGSPRVASRLTSYALDRDESQHVFYIGDNAHIIELSWMGTDMPQPADLTEQFGAPLGALNLDGPVSLVFSTESTQHVFYTTGEGEIIELWQ
jgi:hypothetical protein